MGCASRLPPSVGQAQNLDLLVFLVIFNVFLVFFWFFLFFFWFFGWPAGHPGGQTYAGRLPVGSFHVFGIVSSSIIGPPQLVQRKKDYFVDCVGYLLFFSRYTDWVPDRSGGKCFVFVLFLIFFCCLGGGRLVTGQSNIVLVAAGLKFGVIFGF